MCLVVGVVCEWCVRVAFLFYISLFCPCSFIFVFVCFFVCLCVVSLYVVFFFCSFRVCIIFFVFCV